MHPRDTHSRRLRLTIETLEDRLLLAGNVTLPELPRVSPILPIETFAAALLHTDSQVPPGAKPLVTLQKISSSAILWHFPADGQLTLNNHSPKAIDDSVTTGSGTPIRIDVLANDTDPDHDKLYIPYSSQPAHGTLFRDFAHPNSFIYQANAGYVGTDSFTYSVYDRWGDSSNATVHILVTASPNASSVNRPPVAKSDTTSTHAERPVTIDVLGNDTDPDGDKVKLDGITQAAAHGLATIRDGRIVYTPKNLFIGDDTFTYRITDGHGGTALGQVMVHVTNKPVVAIDDKVTTHPGELVRIDVLGNDRDGDGDPLHLVRFTQPTGGVVTQVGQRLVFTPLPGFSGQTSFSYIAADRFGSQSTATVRIDVANRPPIAVNDFASTRMGKAVWIDVLANDRDRDGDRIRLVSVGATKMGGTATIVATDARRIRYTPKAGFTGEDQFTYTIDDGHGGKVTGIVFIHVTQGED